MHADASNFATGVSKQEAYEQVLAQAEGLFDGQRNWVSQSSLFLVVGGPSQQQWHEDRIALVAAGLSFGSQSCSQTPCCDYLPFRHGLLTI